MMTATKAGFTWVAQPVCEAFPRLLWLEPYFPEVPWSDLKSLTPPKGHNQLDTL